MPRAATFLFFTLAITPAYAQLGCESPRPHASPGTHPPVAVSAKPSLAAAKPALTAASAPRTEPAPSAPYDFAAVLDGDGKTSVALCETSRTVGFPSTDKPSKAERASVRGTESRMHYYGIGIPVDYVKARHAAFVELEKHDPRLFGNEVILMMLYANGFGTGKNIDLAIKLACKNWHAPMERDGRVAHLNALRSTAGDTPFDLCDDITSGFMEGACAGLAEERANVRRERDLVELTARWSVAELDALRRLRGVADAFWNARSGYEVDLSGTDRSAAIIAEDAAGRAAFLAALQRFEQGKVPEGSADAYRDADDRLNRTYKAALSTDFTGTTLRAEDIRATERAWLVYRNEWIAFGAVRYPAVRAEAWNTWLSTARAEQLELLLQP